NLSIVIDSDPIHHRQRFGMDVSDVNDGQPQLFLDMLDLDLQLLAELLVERTQRLVHQHENRVEDQRTREGDTLLLPTRQLGRSTMIESAELNQLKRACDPLFQL